MIKWNIDTRNTLGNENRDGNNILDAFRYFEWCLRYCVALKGYEKGGFQIKEVLYDRVWRMKYLGNGFHWCRDMNASFKS